MADQTTNKFRNFRPRGGTVSQEIADGVTIGIGALVQIQSGKLNHWDKSGIFLGVLINGDSRLDDGVITGESSDRFPPRGTVDISGVTLTGVAVANATAAGALVHCADSDPANLTTATAQEPPIGYISDFRSASDCDVTFFTPSEFLAGIAGATWTS